MNITLVILLKMILSYRTGEVIVVIFNGNLNTFFMLDGKIRDSNRLILSIIHQRRYLPVIACSFKTIIINTMYLF